MLQIQFFSSLIHKFMSNLLVKRVLFLLIAAFDTAILDLISCVKLAQSVITLAK
jgi:hypothetical protein